jgi:hypothetical protein
MTCLYLQDFCGPCQEDGVKECLRQSSDKKNATACQACAIKKRPCSPPPKWGRKPIQVTIKSESAPIPSKSSRKRTAVGKSTHSYSYSLVSNVLQRCWRMSSLHWKVWNGHCKRMVLSSVIASLTLRRVFATWLRTPVSIYQISIYVLHQYQRSMLQAPERSHHHH